MTLGEIRKLWRKHGGDQHGPRVETWTIPEDNMQAFVSDLLSQHDNPLVNAN